jgi:4-hydroxybenzoate polyprenyltransferase
MSSIDLAARYLAERARPAVLIPLAALLAFTAWAVTPSTVWSIATLLSATVTALLFILAFRVWDDLEDRARDAREHPKRVMVTNGRTKPFVILALVLGLAGATIIVLGNDRLARVGFVAGAVAILAAWYRLRSDSSATVLSEHVVLIKYPAIALALAPTLPTSGVQLWRAVAIVTAVYLSICVYESFDDPGLRASRAVRRVAMAELVVIVPLIVSAFTSFGAGVR